MKLLTLVIAVLTATATFASAATLRVGPHRALSLPSEAARLAQAGDTIAIDPGEYVDCAVWVPRGLTIRGEGAGVVVRGRICDGKGIFVTVGNNITIQNVTLADARSPTHNGAGIRAEGRDLTVEHARFLDDEDGILAANSADSRIRVADSEFRGNGSCAAECAHGIYIGRVASLRVERSRFSGTRMGHHIKSRARETTVIDSLIEDGPRGSSSYLIDIPDGGSILIQGNRMSKGPRSDNPGIAISVGGEGSTNPTLSLVVRDNGFTNTQSVGTVFVRNATASDARLSGNALRGEVTPLQGPGTVR